MATYAGKLVRDTQCRSRAETLTLHAWSMHTMTTYYFVIKLRLELWPAYFVSLWKANGVRFVCIMFGVKSFTWETKHRYNQNIEVRRHTWCQRASQDSSAVTLLFVQVQEDLHMALAPRIVGKKKTEKHAACTMHLMDAKGLPGIFGDILHFTHNIFGYAKYFSGTLNGMVEWVLGWTCSSNTYSIGNLWCTLTFCTKLVIASFVYPIHHTERIPPHTPEFHHTHTHTHTHPLFTCPGHTTHYDNHCNTIENTGCVLGVTQKHHHRLTSDNLDKSKWQWTVLLEVIQGNTCEMSCWKHVESSKTLSHWNVE